MTTVGRHALPGQCFTEDAKAQCRVETAECWARSMLKQTVLAGFMAAKLLATDLCTQMVVVPVNAEAQCSGTEWVDVDDLHSSELAEVALLARARVESLLDKPHALGLLEVQLRNVVQRRWSSCKKCNRYGQLRDPEPEWRTEKTAVMRVAPEKIGAVGEPDSYVPKLNEIHRPVPRLNEMQKSLAKRLKSFDRDHPAAQ